MKDPCSYPLQRTKSACPSCMVSSLFYAQGNLHKFFDNFKDNTITKVTKTDKITKVMKTDKMTKVMKTDKTTKVMKTKEKKVMNTDKRTKRKKPYKITSLLTDKITLWNYLRIYLNKSTTYTAKNLQK